MAAGAQAIIRKVAGRVLVRGLEQEESDPDNDAVASGQACWKMRGQGESDGVGQILRCAAGRKRRKGRRGMCAWERGTIPRKAVRKSSTVSVRVRTDGQAGQVHVNKGPT